MVQNNQIMNDAIIMMILLYKEHNIATIREAVNIILQSSSLGKLANGSCIVANLERPSGLLKIQKGI